MLNDREKDLVTLTDGQLSTLAHIGADAVFRILLRTLPDSHEKVFCAVRDAQRFVNDELTRLYTIAEYAKNRKAGLHLYIPETHHIREWPKAHKGE